jgi:hypothetical protein
MHVHYSNKLINSTILKIIQTQILNRYRQEWEWSGPGGFRAPSARAWPHPRGANNPFWRTSPVHNSCTRRFLSYAPRDQLAPGLQNRTLPNNFPGKLHILYIRCPGKPVGNPEQVKKTYFRRNISGFPTGFPSDVGTVSFRWIIQLWLFFLLYLGI